MKMTLTHTKKDQPRTFCPLSPSLKVYPLMGDAGAVLQEQFQDGSRTWDRHCQDSPPQDPNYPTIPNIICQQSGNWHRNESSLGGYYEQHSYRRTQKPRTKLAYDKHSTPRNSLTKVSSFKIERAEYRSPSRTQI